MGKTEKAQNDKEKVTRGDHVKVTHPGKNK
jgi:hypothetical protein